MSPLTPNVAIPPTQRSPRVDFDFQNGRFLISGESYPEDAARFFGPLLQAVEDHVAGTPDGSLVFDLALAYFNSSTAKALMNLFDLLERAAGRGVPVVVNWHFAPEDDAMREFGEDFSEDIHTCVFNLCADRDG
ncbi:MAG TPA: DUF1987 domain-containing protein [Stellaceae bacterium]|nr:DUF1987 domain-containing protein [Stellaceae bacterium]